MCSRTLWVSPTNSPVRLQVSPAASTPCRFFSIRGFEALFPCTGTLGCMVCLAPQLFLLVHLHAKYVGPPAPLAASLPALVLQPPPYWESSSLWLPIYTPPISLDECFFFNSWLLDFHTVRFSGSSGYFFILNLLLSFFWFCKEANISIYASTLARSEKPDDD